MFSSLMNVKLQYKSINIIFIELKVNVGSCYCVVVMLGLIAFLENL